MSYFHDISIIMSSLEQWLDDNTIRHTPPPGMLARSPIVPDILAFHCSNSELQEQIQKWSIEVLPGLSYDDRIYEISKLRDILTPHSGRDLYLINFILGCVAKESKEKFIEGLVGGVLTNKICTHIIKDPDCSYTNESYFVYLYRQIMNEYKNSNLSLMFPFIRMIKWNRVDVSLVECTDFSSKYEKLFEKEGENYNYCPQAKDFLMFPTSLTEKEYKFYNNPKQIYDLVKEMMAKYEETKDIDVIMLYINKYYDIFNNKIAISVSI